MNVEGARFPTTDGHQRQDGFVRGSMTAPIYEDQVQVNFPFNDSWRQTVMVLSSHGMQPQGHLSLQLPPMTPVVIPSSDHHPWSAGG